MIIKPIKDPKIDKIVNKSKDYEMKANANDILEAFKAKKVLVTPKEIEIAPSKPKKIWYQKPVFIGSMAFASIALVVGVTLPFTLNAPSVISNISNNTSILTSTDSEVSKTLSKELLLFNLNYSESQNSATNAVKKVSDYYGINTETSFLDGIFENIKDGFNSVAQIFLSEIFSLDEIEIKDNTLKTPKIINDIEFDKRIDYEYGKLIGIFPVVEYSYYYSSKENIGYGYTEIPVFLGRSMYFKTELNQIMKDGKVIINSTFTLNENTGASFKIKDIKDDKLTGDSFIYDVYASESNLSKNEFYKSFFINFGDEETKPLFALEKNNDYKIKYLNISLSELFNLSFDVDYLDLINSKKFSFFASLSSDGSNNDYEFSER